MYIFLQTTQEITVESSKKTTSVNDTHLILSGLGCVSADNTGNKSEVIQEDIIRK